MDTWTNLKCLSDQRIKDAYQYAENQRLAKAAKATQSSRLTNLLRSIHPIAALAQTVRNLNPGEFVGMNEPIVLLKQPSEYQEE